MKQKSSENDPVYIENLKNEWEENLRIKIE